MIIANGNLLTLASVEDDCSSLVKKQDYQTFQKAIMKVRYEPTQKRIVAGGLDCQLKFYSLNTNEETKQ